MEKLSKYFEDKHFIEQIFEETPEAHAWLSQFEADHPEEKDNIQLARKIILQFRTTRKILSEEEKIVLFSGIIREIEETQKRGRSRSLFYNFLKYAAVALVFFTIGALVFQQRESISPEFLSQSFPEALHDKSAKLIRSTGEDIVLSQDNPVIEHGVDGNLQIDKRIVEAQSANPKKAAKTFNQLIIPYGKTSQVILSDGTKVYLNAGSRLVYPEIFSGSTREVLLTGEAFFDVTTDNKKPFIVQTSHLKVKVLGTRFNLSAYASDNYIDAVLAEGKISLVRNDAGFFDKPVELAPGQLISFSRATSEMLLRKVDIDNYILWTEGVFKFESVHLSRILKRLERYYDIRFQFKDAFLGTVQISGKLELKEELNETIERIGRAAQVNIVKTPSGEYEVRK